jgi:hypothetical protein
VARRMGVAGIEVTVADNCEWKGWNKSTLQ